MFASLPYHEGHRAGLRSAVRRSSTRIELVVGPGIRPGVVSEKAQHFHVVSPTDTDFQLGVSAVSARITSTKPDVVYPHSYAGPKFDRHEIEIALPAGRPMKDGHRYWARICTVWVVGRNHAGAWIVAEGDEAKHEDDMEYGIREIGVISPVVVRLVTGPGVDLKRLTAAGSVTVHSEDDPGFRVPVAAKDVGRRSSLDFYIPNGWPWRFHQRHDLYVVLPKPMTSGKTYTVDLNAKGRLPVVCGRSSATLRLDDRTSVNLAIKVNQYGYVPAQKEKYAYLGVWMGDLNACDFSRWAGNFEVRDAATHAVVMRGRPEPRRKATYRLVDGKAVPDPKKVKGPETVYKQDLSYEDVYQLDLSGLTKSGTYYVAVPGMGRSFAFRIADDVYVEPFRVVMNGIFHQRCGIELEEPYTTHYRPACHRNLTEYSTFRRDVDKDPWKNLPKHETDGKKHDLYGGHHDAGDWNPRAHLEVAEVLQLLYEMNSAAFTDGQLNIPENANGIPDILDEAYWALDLWKRLQGPKDGGVCHGIESNGDPKEGDAAATDSLREFAFAKDAAGTYWFAAVAAQMSGIQVDRGAEKQATYLRALARRAWEWAEENGGEEEHDRHVFAAAMLLRETGEAKYDEAFKKHSVYTRDRNAVPMKYNKHDQLYGSYHYAMQKDGDPQLKRTIVKSFERFFESWRAPAATTTYRYMRSPYSPNTWGTGGLPKWLVMPAMTMRLTKRDDVRAACRQWIAFTCDFSLGCHPMNLVFTVGLGQRYVTTAWHHLMHHSPEGLIPGLQSEAAGGKFVSGADPGRGGMGAWPGMSMYPPGPWPDLYKYSEDASPGMNEGVVVTQAGTAFAYGILMPAAEE